MAKYVCIKKNYGFQKRLHEKGAVVEINGKDLEHPSMKFFKPVGGEKPAEKVEEKKVEGKKVEFK